MAYIGTSEVGAAKGLANQDALRRQSLKRAYQRDMEPQTRTPEEMAAMQRRKAASKAIEEGQGSGVAQSPARTPEELTAMQSRKAAYQRGMEPQAPNQNIGGQSTDPITQLNSPQQTPKRSAYDLRRDQITADAQQEKARRQEALKERLASSGTGQGGLAEKLAAMTEGQVGSDASRRSADIDIEELNAGERISESDKDRKLQEQLGMRSLDLQGRGQDISKELGGRGLDLQSRGQDISVSEADKSRNFAASENALGRKFTSSERQAVETFNKFMLEDQQAYGTQERVGSENAAQRSQQMNLAFTKGENALGRKFTTDERKAIEAYQTSSREDVQQFGADESTKAYNRNMAAQVNSQGFQAGMATLNNKLQQGNIRLADEIQDANEKQDVMDKSYYNQGLSGQVIEPQVLLSLKYSNPRAYQSYMSGKAGESIDKVAEKNKLIQTYFNARVVGLDPDSASYKTKLTEISNDLAKNLGYGSGFFGEGSTSSPDAPLPKNKMTGSKDYPPEGGNPKEGDKITSEDGTLWAYVNGEWVKPTVLGGYPSNIPPTTSRLYGSNQ